MFYMEETMEKLEKLEKNKSTDNANPFSKYIVPINCTIRHAFKQMDINKKKFVLVKSHEDTIVGVVTDGDFRRAIFKGISFENGIETITNKEFLHFSHPYALTKVRKAFKENANIKQIPILKEGLLQDIIFEKDLSRPKHAKIKNKLDLPVVIMAGGQGKRLDPFTRVLPKPLIPIENTPAVEVIMDGFARFGMKSFHLSIFEKGKMIKAYFDDFNKPYNIFYMEESEPRGTIGALSMLKNEIDKPLFVTNCDVIIDADYSKFYDFHKKGGFDLSIIGSMRYYSIPYGVCNIESDGTLNELIEKPQYDFLVSTGFYLINPSILKHIPDVGRYDFTHFIADLKRRGHKIGVYPVSEKSWLDIGQWAEYKNSIELLSNPQFG